MNAKLLTKHHLEFLSLKGGFTDSPEATLVKMQHCWKSHVAAHYYIYSVCQGLTGTMAYKIAITMYIPFPILKVYLKHQNQPVVDRQVQTHLVLMHSTEEQKQVTIRTITTHLNPMCLGDPYNTFTVLTLMVHYYKYTATNPSPSSHKINTVL